MAFSVALVTSTSSMRDARCFARMSPAVIWIVAVVIARLLSPRCRTATGSSVVSLLLLTLRADAHRDAATQQRHRHVHIAATHQADSTAVRAPPPDPHTSPSL